MNSIFSLLNPFSRTTNLGLTRPLTEMSTTEYSWGGKARPAHKADNLTAIGEAIV
jgi:hypothetical protein